MSSIGDIYTNLAFWRQIQGDAKRTVLCEPHHFDELHALIEERRYGNVITVRASAACPEGEFLILDEAAMEASQRQMLQRLQKGIRFHGG